MISIRTKIIIIVLVFFSFTGVSFVVYSLLTTRNYKDLRLEGIKKTVEYETEKVNKIIAEMERGAVHLATDGLLMYKSQSLEVGVLSAIEYLRSFPLVHGGGFWFEPYAYNNNTLRANIYEYYDKDEGGLLLYTVEDDYDYHSMDWYREIADAVERPYQVVWTRPYIDDDTSSTLMTTAGAGIFDESGRLIAISNVDWEIEEVISELTAIKPTENSFVLLCVPEQDYIISGTRMKSVIGESITSLPWDITADSFELDKVKYLRFSKYIDNGWYLSVQIPENEIFADIEKHNNMFSILIAVSAIILLLITYVLISKFINDPLHQLTTDVSQLALGNLDTRITAASKDELGLLAETFNKMTNDLKKSIEENARERALKERIDTELSVATEIQASMLPCIFPAFPGRIEFDLYAAMLPAREVGGDFYDFFLIDEDNLAVVIADVSGKGVPAALFMVIAKTLIKNNSSFKNPKNVFRTVNEKLCENNAKGMFVTAFLGIYNIPSGKFVFVNAGHPPPLLKKKDGSFQLLKTEPCVVLAWKEDAEYAQEEITLEAGDILGLYTDGITEAMNAQRELFGEERLLAAADKHSDLMPREFMYLIKHEMDNFTKGAEQTDDITMLTLKINDTAELEEIDDTMKELKVEARLNNLSKVLEFINSELNKLKYPADLQNEINVAVEEIFTNIAKYAYKPAKGNAAIFISTSEKLSIRFEDTGRKYNPLEQTAPDLEKPAEHRTIGGLGIFLVKQLMDTVEYSRVKHKNILVITRKHP